MQDRKNNLEQDKDSDLLTLDQKREQLEQEFKQQKQVIAGLRQENNQFEYEIRKVEIETNTIALSNQIYRMASYVDNVENYKEVSRDSLTLVGLIWFGSLAFIGSITGVALTLSGLHLKGLAERMETKQYEQNERDIAEKAKAAAIEQAEREQVLRDQAKSEAIKQSEKERLETNKTQDRDE
ncbi:hypothetical protein L0B53_02180 [Vibrio sp. SS-MA-C1-2]|uniref:hypothetical protein n=1 Tax=Vibrio sp. SS-MA-C1-2 TaxID=2908646 RepID=UPI001F2D3B56|nr:hypothetical protein [Vibrio sp. SS-MA-C1-2]UJF17598.1 hypothetical protein L0B53_02180 [Vibrio sp. SS-MA-C1-2]